MLKETDNTFRKPQEILELTSLRFFAAFHVVLFHCSYLIGPDLALIPSWLIRMIGQGSNAVSFFFILSGFILTYVYVKPNMQFSTSWKKFMQSRVARIYPLYLLGLFLDLPRGIIYFFETYDFSVALSKFFISISAHILMIQSWHPRLTSAWNPPAWSLSTEMFFYLIFPFVIVHFLKINKSVISFCILYIVPPLLYYMVRIHFEINIDLGEGATWWRSFPVVRCFEFFLGIILGKGFIENNNLVRWIKNHESVAELITWLVLFTSLLLISFDLNWPQVIVGHVILVPCFCFLILSFASVQYKSLSFLRCKLIVTLGRASYALYIIHIPILFYIVKGLSFLSLSHGLIFFLIYLVIAVSISYLFLNKIELPIQKRIKRQIK